MQEDLEDAHARAVWALSEIMSNEKLTQSLRNQAKMIFCRVFDKSIAFTHLRSKAFIIKAFALTIPVLPEKSTEMTRCIKKYSDSLVASAKDHSDLSWHWYENHLHYSNGLLPESLFIAGDITGNTQYTTSALKTLRFLIGKTFSATMYRPIGHSQWYKKNQTRSYYDQQPEDPTSMIQVLARAYTELHQEEYKNLAKRCFSWFMGNNSLHLPLYDFASGGCYDGLHPDRVNLNQGAESLISFHMSRYIIKELH